MQNLESFFAQAVKIVDTELDRLIPAANSEPKKLHQAIRWSVFGGGKRFRPILLLAVGRTFGAKNESLVRIAAAIEMIHTYSLIHDDLPSMDDDDLRRGRETCHKKFGEATAILAGDALQALAFKTISEESNLDPKTRVRLISEIATAAGTRNGMVGGQQMDLDAEGEEASVQSVESIHRNKTGSLIRASAIAGTIIGGASENEIKIISNYANDLGLLFQVTDDIIDVSQTSEALGKTAGKDAAKRKATYPAVYGLDKSMDLARGLFSKIESELEGIGRPHSILIELARFVLDRKS
jgi:geranylgeranyl diphosphate synthase type II